MGICAGARQQTWLRTSVRDLQGRAANVFLSAASSLSSAAVLQNSPGQTCRVLTIAYTNSGALEKNGSGAFVGHIFCLKRSQTSRRSTRRDRALSIAVKARIAAARPLAGTLSAGSLAAKALIAAARAY